MVKVQKPTPKTLSNAGKLDNTKKIKKEVKKLKTSVTGGALQAKKQKVELKKKTVKKAEVVAPEKEKVNKKATEPNAGKFVLAPLSMVTPITEKNKQPKKRPAVLAPPASPAPLIPVPVGGKPKSNKLKKSASVGPVASAVAFSAKKGKKTKSLLKTDDRKNVATKPLTKNQKKKAAIKAFKKQQLLRKLSGKGKEDRAVPEHIYKPVPFDEDKFKAILSIENIKRIGASLKALAEMHVESKKVAIFSDYRYSLNVVSFKIPSCPKRMVKLSLKHSLVDKDDDIVIIVPDLKRGSKVDYEPTIQHFEDIFREAGIEGLKIMPFNQLRTEFNTYDTLRKLARTYDYFLCDGRLVGRTTGLCGKIFQKPRTTFHAVRLKNNSFLKNDIEKALRRTAYSQLHKGNLISIPVGNHKYTMQQLAENVDHVVGQLKNIFPGGLSNVRALHLKIDIRGTASLPLYVSMAQAPTDTPYVVGQREKRMLKLKKEANEVLSKFAITKDAKLVKLTDKQVENKRQIKEARAALDAKTKETSNDDGEDPAVPSKKSKKEEKTDVEKDSKKKSGDEQAEPEDDSDEEAVDDSDDEDDDVADDGDDDEDDDDEGNAEEDEDDDDDDDEDNEEDEDEDGDDDEDDEEEDSD